MKYDKRNKEALRDLHFLVSEKVEKLLEVLEEKELEILIYEGWRSAERQDKMYASNRTEVGPWKTDLRGGYSYHNYGMAIDFVPCNNKGEIDYDDSKTYNLVAKEARKLGFEWGGDWFYRDCPHLQYTGGLKIADLRLGKDLSGMVEPRYDKSLSQIALRAISRGIARSTGKIREMLVRKRKRIEKRLNK